MEVPALNFRICGLFSEPGGNIQIRTMFFRRCARLVRGALPCLFEFTEAKYRTATLADRQARMAFILRDEDSVEIRSTPVVAVSIPSSAAKWVSRAYLVHPVTH